MSKSARAKDILTIRMETYRHRRFRRGAWAAALLSSHILAVALSVTCR